MKVGSLVYATDSGLGILARAFYDNGIVTHPFVIKHAHFLTHYDWYPDGTPTCHIKRPDMEAIRRYCQAVDVMLFFETPFWWELIDFCRANGVRTALMPMYECMPEYLPTCPDLMLCPSELDLRYYPNERWTCRTTKSAYLPVPVWGHQFRLRTKAEVFVHNAGHGGLKGRNGTAELLEAWQYVKSPARLVVRDQNEGGGPTRRTAPFLKIEGGKQLELRKGTVEHSQLYSEGDVFVFPEKFNGLSLPLQEAYASGMLVMAGDRFPMNQWLPIDPLIVVRDQRITRLFPRLNQINEAVYEPRDIAAAIDNWYGRDITHLSLQGQAWGISNSWEVWRASYLQVLSDLVEGRLP